MTENAATSSATQALLQFAATEESDAPLSNFDEADVSHRSLGSQVKDQAWWDPERSGLKLRQRSLSGASLRRADLTHADLAGASLTSVKGAGLNLTRACLEGTDLTDADLIGATLVSASAGEANFSGALLEDADLHAAHLRFAQFTDTIMDGANLSDADLWGGQFDKVAAERTNFARSRLDESSMVDAELSSSDFTGASLRKANLTNAKLRGAVLRDAVLDGANLSSTDLSGAVMPNVSLTTCTLTHAKFAGAWMERTRMRASQLGGQVGEEVAHDLEAALESYIVLERNFLSLGSTDDASWAYRRRRRVGRALHAKQSLQALKAKSWPACIVSASQWLGDSAAEWLCDYGESLARVARAFFCLLIGFAAVYWMTGSLAPREGVAVVRHSYSMINYLLFSLDSMTTVGTSEVALRPSGELGMLLSSLQTVLGTITLGLFGFVLGARIRN